MDHRDTNNTATANGGSSDKWPTEKNSIDSSFLFLKPNAFSFILYVNCHNIAKPKYISNSVDIFWNDFRHSTFMHAHTCIYITSNAFVIVKSYIWRISKSLNEYKEQAGRTHTLSLTGNSILEDSVALAVSKVLCLPTMCLVLWETWHIFGWNLLKWEFHAVLLSLQCFISILNLISFDSIVTI